MEEGGRVYAPAPAPTPSLPRRREFIPSKPYRHHPLRGGHRAPSPAPAAAAHQSLHFVLRQGIGLTRPGRLEHRRASAAKRTCRWNIAQSDRGIFFDCDLCVEVNIGGEIGDSEAACGRTFRRQAVKLVPVRFPTAGSVEATFLCSLFLLVSSSLQADMHGINLRFRGQPITADSDAQIPKRS